MRDKINIGIAPVTPTILTNVGVAIIGAGIKILLPELKKILRNEEIYKTISENLDSKNTQLVLGSLGSTIIKWRKRRL